MIRSSKALLVAAVLLGTLSQAQAADTGSLSLQVPLFKTKAKGDVIKFQPFKSAKDPFLVTVALYDGDSGEALTLADGATPWTETFTVTANDAAPSDPANGDLREPAKVTGATTVVLGSTVDLPPDLLERSVLFTSQLTLIKKGQELPPFEESPRRPLGLDGAVAGQSLAPAAVSTEALALTTGAADGLVLTSDAAGNASWEPLPDLPGVAGTVNRIAVFDSDSSISDSSISDTGAKVVVDVPLEVIGTVNSSSDLVAADDLSAGDDLFVGDNAIVQGDVNATGNVTAGGALNAGTLILSGDAFALDITGEDLTGSSTVRAGSPSAFSVTSGDVAADDDLLADDDLFVGDNATVSGTLFVSESVSVTQNGTFSGTLTAASLTASGDVKSTNGALVTGTPASAFAAGDIASTSDVFADLDVVAGDDLIAADELTVGDRASIGGFTAPDDGDLGVADDVHVGDDIVAGGQLDVNGTFISNLSATNSELQLRSNGDQVFIRDFALGDSGLVDETHWFDGAAGLGGDLEMRLDSAGSLSVDGSFNSGGADLAEWFPTVDNSLEPGALVALDPTAAEHVLRAEFGRHELLLGVVPTAPGLLMGSGDVMGPSPELLRLAYVAAEQGDMAKARELRALWRDSVDNQAGRVAVALQGRVPVKVDLSGGLIEPGDRLGMSARAGFAARYSGYGPVVGLAMQGFDGAGADDTVIVFLGLDHSPDASNAGAFGAATLVEGLAELERAGGTFNGQGQVAAGATRVVVQDERLTADSLPVVTFYGNPGGSSWVSERGDGWFVLELDEPARDWLDFGFSATR